MASWPCSVEDRQPQHHGREGGEQPDDREHGDLPQTRKRGKGQGAVTEQRREQAEYDARQDATQPLGRRAAGGIKYTRGVVQAVIDGHTDEAGSEEQGGNVQFAEHNEAARKCASDTDPNHQQVEQKGPHTAEYDDDEENGAEERQNREDRSFTDRRPRGRFGEEHGAQALDLKSRIKLPERSS